MIDYIITSLVILIAGISLMIFPPATKLNRYGYNSKQARKNPENWRLAQRLAGRSLTWVGGITLILSVLLYYLLPSNLSRFASVLIPIIGILIAVRKIEITLKKWDSNGKTQNQ